MSTITREFTKEQLKQIIETDHVQCGEASALARIALASLEAEAVGEVIEQQSGMMLDGLVISEKPTYRNIKGIHNMKMMPLGTKFYTAPPAPVVPAPTSNSSSAFEDFWSNFEHPFAEDDELKSFASEIYRAAMLQGADVSLTHEGKNHHEDKLGMVNHLGDVTEKVEPVTQIEPVADLYGLTSPTGGETSFTFDAVEARDFIDGGWSCQEYVELERFQEALTDHSEGDLDMVRPVMFIDGNLLPGDAEKLKAAIEELNHSGEPTIMIAGDSPVIPDGWVMVPVDMPHEMMRAVQVNSELGAYAATNLNGAYSLFREFWDVAVTAAPQQEMNT